jgi:putative hydrolase of the HAD superfamily
MIKGIFFDLCGTLLTYGDMDTAWQKWLESCYVCFKESGFNKNQEYFFQACNGMYDKPAPPFVNDGLTVYERRIKSFCQEIGHIMSVSELQNTATSTLNTWNRYLYLDQDSQTVLETLQKKYRLALISNFDHPPFIHSTLKEYGLKPYFSEIIISGEVGIEKPDPQIFNLALKATGLKESEVFHVGDNLDHDIKGARNAGITPILIQRNMIKETAHPEVKTIRKLTELLDFLPTTIP